jgi:hypothetical protein
MLVFPTHAFLLKNDSASVFEPRRSKPREHVCPLRPESGQITDISGCPLGAKRRHRHFRDLRKGISLVRPVPVGSDAAE